MKKVTIQDVAKKLNLSRNTVARALNNSSTVAYETRYLVIKCACDMGYLKLSPAVLNEFKLRTKHNEYKTIVVLARRELSVFWNSIIMGISDEVNKNGCKLRLNFISEDDEQNLILPMDFSENVDAVLFISVFDIKYTSMILKLSIPSVFLDAPIHNLPEGNHFDTIICEGRTSIRKITESLIEKGLTKLAFIGDISYCESLKQRYIGFCEAHENMGLNVNPRLTAIKHKPNKYYKTLEVEEAIDNFPFAPEAIVCANDDIAIDTIRILKKKNLNVPGDIAVTGFDNVEAMTQAEPILTTVEVKNQLVGRRLVQQLLWRIEHPDFPSETIWIETQPLYRKSTDVRKYTADN